MNRIPRVKISLTVDRFLIVCFVLSLGGFILALTEGYLNWDPLIVIAILSSAFLSIYFIKLLRLAKRRIYLDLISDQVYDKYEWAALVFKDVEDFLPRKNFISWKLKNGETVGAKIFSVTDVPYTFKELKAEELDRRLRSYSHLINSGNMSIITYHMKLPIDKDSYVENLRKERDVLRTSYEVGGPATHIEKAKEKEAVITRIKEGLEEPYEARFFVAVLMRGSDVNDVHRKLEDVTPSVLTRFRNDIGVFIEELEDMDLLDACSFFFHSPTWQVT